MRIARLYALTAIAALFAAPLMAAEPALTDDGLVPIKVRNVDKAYKKPGASLQGYSRILIRPVTVAFNKHWDPRDYGGTFGLKPQDVEKIRSGLSDLAQKTFTQVLTKGGYTVVQAAGEGVLEVEAQIVELFINAPEAKTADPRRAYVLNAGEMRLLVTLRDSVTGTTLYRANDFERAPETGRLEWANSVWNTAQADLVLSKWANVLKKSLDAAKSN
jgi:Protein of unknown function (DUF3313)